MAKLLTKIAEDYGDAPALIDEFGETSWRQINDRVNRLVNALRAAGLEKGDTLSVLSENRREYFEIIAAATHCGLRYVPMNWHWVAEELAYVLADSDSHLSQVTYATGSPAVVDEGDVLLDGIPVAVYDNGALAVVATPSTVTVVAPACIP